MAPTPHSTLTKDQKRPSSRSWCQVEDSNLRPTDYKTSPGILVLFGCVAIGLIVLAKRSGSDGFRVV